MDSTAPKYAMMLSLWNGVGTPCRSARKKESCRICRQVELNSRIHKGNNHVLWREAFRGARQKENEGKIRENIEYDCSIAVLTLTRPTL